MNGSKIIMVVVGIIVVVIVGVIAGVLGYSGGQKAGYDKAVADLKAQQEALAQTALEEAAKAANPFQAANPLEGVELNPFEKAKKALNPFE